MAKDYDCLMTRKEFLKKSSAGLLGLGLLGKMLSLTEPPKACAQAAPAYRILGRTGLKVTTIGYGASRTMEPSLVKTALDKGLNFLDTGRVYYNGQNEEMVGKVIKGVRKEVIVQTRITIPSRGKGGLKKTAKASQSIAKKMQSSLQASLKALQTDYLDIVLIHGATSLDIINHETVMDFFRAAKAKGQIRACGFSSHSNQVALLKAANESKFYDVIMVPYNHKGSYKHSLGGHYNEWDQSALESELKKAEQNKIGIVAMKTCSGGPYAPDGKSKPTYKAALQWILNHNYIGTMAVAMGNIKEINENVQVMF